MNRFYWVCMVWWLAQASNGKQGSKEGSTQARKEARKQVSTRASDKALANIG
jgi:hypothetical protein